MEVAAVLLRPSYIFQSTKSLFPDTIAYKQGRVTITRRRWFGLARSRDDVGVPRMVSVELHSSIFNATVVIQASVRRDVDLSVNHLPKKQA